MNRGLKKQIAKAFDAPCLLYTSAELTLWNAASRYLHANLTDTKTLPISKWKHEYADLKDCLLYTSRR